MFKKSMIRILQYFWEKSLNSEFHIKKHFSQKPEVRYHGLPF